jgi:hypothetical protein
VARSAARAPIRSGDWEFALVSTAIDAGLSDKPGLKFAEVDVKNLGLKSVTLDAQLVTRGAGIKDTTAAVTATVPAGWTQALYFNYDSRASSSWQFGLVRDDGTISWFQ